MPTTLHPPQSINTAKMGTKNHLCKSFEKFLGTKVQINFLKNSESLPGVHRNTIWVMATIRERLTEFAKTQGFKTLSGFEGACGFTKNTLTKDREGISSTTLIKIVDFFPQLSLDWVILGRGNMTVDECPHCSTPAPQNDIHHNQQVVIANWGDLKDVLTEVIKEQVR